MNPQPTNFNFDSTQTSPYTTAPSSPKILIPNMFYTSSCVENENIDEKEEFNHDLDFAFEFSGQLESPLISAADELFHGGKIKPLDPQPPSLSTNAKQQQLIKPYKHSPKKSISQHKASRSLSPVRVSDILSSNDQKLTSSTTTSSPFGFMWYNKWNLKDLLLFRSTSEGSARISKDTKNTSFRSNDGSIAGSSRKMKRKVSAHEMHYTANRAVAQGMKRKTFLPYKSGLLGCLGFGYYSHNSIHETSFRGRSSTV